MNKKYYLANFVGIIIVLLVVAYFSHRPGHIPPYDANLIRIAETERQGYCSGDTYWKTSGEGSARLAAECRSKHKEQSGKVNLLATERGFCQAIVDQGWEGFVSDCLAILSDNQYWPTYDGNITDQWNRARPYPNVAIISGDDATDGSRTGGRSDGGRGSTNTRPGSSYPGYGWP